MAFANLGISLTARLGNFSKGIKRATRMIRRFARRARRAAKAARLGFAAIAAGGVALMTKGIFQSIDSLAKMSDRIGIATEDLATLRHQARLSGVGINQLDIGLQRMVRRVAEAAAGTGEAQGALRELGLDAVKLTQLTPDQQMKRIADAMSEVDDQTERVRLAFKLFDSEGVGLVNTLRLLEGDGFRKAKAEAKALGIALTRDQAKKVEKANDEWTRLMAVFQGISIVVAAQLAPHLERIGKTLIKAFGDGNKFVENLSSGMDNLSSTFETFSGRVKQVLEWFRMLIKAGRELVAFDFEKAAATFAKFKGGDLAGGFGDLAAGAVAKWDQLFANVEGIVRAFESARSPGEMRNVFGANVVARAQGMTENTRAEVLQRTTPGREQDLLPVLESQLAVLGEIKARIEGRAPARAGR